MLVREGAGSGGLPGLDCPPWPRESPRRPARATDPRGPGDSQYPGGRSSHSWQDKHISELSLGWGVRRKVFTVKVISSRTTERTIIRSYRLTISTSSMSRMVTGVTPAVVIKAPLVSKLSIRPNSSLEELKLGNLV